MSTASTTATPRLRFRFAAIPEAMLQAHGAGLLRDGDLAIVSKLLLRFRGWRIHGYDDVLAEAAGVAESTFKACLKRLKTLGLVRSVRATVRGFRRALELVWLAPSEAERQPLFPDDPGAEPLASEGPRARPQDALPPAPPNREELLDGALDGGPAAPPPPTDSPLDQKAGSEPDPGAVRQVVERVARVSPPDPSLPARLAAVAKKWGLSFLLPATDRLERKAARERLENPVGFLVAAMKGMQLDGGPPLVASSLPVVTLSDAELVERWVAECESQLGVQE